MHILIWRDADNVKYHYWEHSVKIIYDLDMQKVNQSCHSEYMLSEETLHSLWDTHRQSLIVSITQNI